MKSIRETMLNFATALVALCALFVTALRARDFLKPDPTKPHRVTSWAGVASVGHLTGPKDAPVKIVEFADYQCPYCQRDDTVIEQLRERYPTEVSVTFRHYPIPSHPYAHIAAQAAECAAHQAVFESFHHQLYATQDSIGHKPWTWFAVNAGVPDTVTFNRCVTAAKDSATIAADVAAGDKLDIHATPTYLINDQQMSGFRTLAQFDSQVVSALRRAKK